MPTYVFKGRNRMNEIVDGERVADNREALRQILRREQVTLTSVKEKGREIGIPKLAGRKNFGVGTHGNDPCRKCSAELILAGCQTRRRQTCTVNCWFRLTFFNLMLMRSIQSR